MDQNIQILDEKPAKSMSTIKFALTCDATHLRREHIMIMNRFNLVTLQDRMMDALLLWEAQKHCDIFDNPN